MQKSRTHRSALRKVIQVADCLRCRKPYKTNVKSIILVFGDAQNVRNCKKALDVLEKNACP